MREDAEYEAATAGRPNTAAAPPPPAEHYDDAISEASAEISAPQSDAEFEIVSFSSRIEHSAPIAAFFQTNRSQCVLRLRASFELLQVVHAS